MRILVIDNDQAWRRLLTDIAHQAYGRNVQVVGAESYSEGLGALSRGPWDLCIVDFRLDEGRNGAELLRRSGAQVPALIVTAQKRDEIPLKLDDGGVRVVEKVLEDIRQAMIEIAPPAPKPSSDKIERPAPPREDTVSWVARIITASRVMYLLYILAAGGLGTGVGLLIGEGAARARFTDDYEHLRERVTALEVANQNHGVTSVRIMADLAAMRGSLDTIQLMLWRAP